MRRRGELAASGLDLLPAPPLRVPPVGAGGRVRALLRPNRAALGRRNRLSNFVFFVLAAAGGSAASAVAVMLAGWALISLAFGRFARQLRRSDLAVVLSTLLFFLVLAASDVFHAAEAGDAGGAARYVGERLLFVLPLFLVPRMRCSRFGDTLPPAFLGSAVGGALLVPVCVLSPEFAVGRVEGLAGNAGPFSIAALLAAGWSLLSLPADGGRLRTLLALLGASGGALAVVSSGMRGAWPALPVVLLIALVARRRPIAGLWQRSTPAARVAVTVAGVLILAIGAYLVTPAVGFRATLFLGDLSQVVADTDSSTSLNRRLEMYRAAATAIAARPWFGYGEAALWSAIRPHLDSRVFGDFSYSHLHNIFLTVGVDAGLVGAVALLLLVAAPLWTAFAARRAEGGGRRLAAAAILVVAFLVPGLSNIMFFHDILDSIWVFAASLVAASVPDRREAEP